MTGGDIKKVGHYCAKPLRPSKASALRRREHRFERAAKLGVSRESAAESNARNPAPFGGVPPCKGVIKM